MSVSAVSASIPPGFSRIAGSQGDDADTSDPVVQDRIATTLAYANLSEPSRVIAFQISETMNDPDLTQEQKDAYLVALIRMATGTSEQAVTSEQADAINLAFDLIGLGLVYSDANTPEPCQQVTDSIARSVAEGSLGGDEIYGLVASGAAGVRQLLTGIDDARLLADLSRRLLEDAKNAGYDINAQQDGAALLTAAADIANMAAAQGDRSAADAVLAEIDRVTQEGPIAGDMTLVQAMMASMYPSMYPDMAGAVERDAVHVLVELLGACSATEGNQEALDRLFAGLVRSGSDDYVGGIDDYYGDDRASIRAALLDQLGEYFDANFARLAETDWRYNNTDSTDHGFYHGLIEDFMRYVLLDADYGRVDQTTSVIIDEMLDLLNHLDESAANTLGTIMGSLEWAIADFTADAEEDAEAKLTIVRTVADKLFKKLLEGVPGGDLGTQVLNEDLWDWMADWIASDEIERADQVLSAVIEFCERVRASIAQEDAAVVAGFDQYENIYYPEDSDD